MCEQWAGVNERLVVDIAAHETRAASDEQALAGAQDDLEV